MALFKLLATCVLPLAIAARWRRGKADDLSIHVNEDPTSVVLALSGAAIGLHVDKAIHHFRNAIDTGKQIAVDVSMTHSVDPRFFGLFLMVRKQLAGQEMQLRFTGVSPEIRRIFRLNRFDFLLPSEV